MVLKYSPDGTNVTNGEVEGIRSV